MIKETIIDARHKKVRQILYPDKNQKKILLKLKSLSLITDSRGSPGKKEADADAKAMSETLTFPATKHLMQYELAWQHHGYICLESIYFQPLTDYIIENGFSLQKLCQLAADMCKALSFLHDNGLLHMDIKEDNIFVHNGRFLLGDFDSMIPLAHGNAGTNLKHAHISLAHTAPELMNEGTASVQSDIYALGQTLQMLFEESSPVPGTESQIEASVKSLYQIIQTFCRKEIEKRPKSIHTFSALLTKLLPHLPDAHYFPPQIMNDDGNRATEQISFPRGRPHIYRLCLPLLLGIFVLAIPGYTVGNRTSIATPVPALQTKPLKQPLPSFGPQNYFSGRAMMADNSAKVLLPKEKPQKRKKNMVYGCDSAITMKMENKNIMDISELQYLYSLQNLYLGNNRIIDLSPLKRLDKLESLYLNSNLISDLMPLKGMKQLKVLLLQDNNITNLQPLCGLGMLEHLDISNNPSISDVSALSALKSLKFLNLIGTSVSKKEQNKLAKALPDCTIIR